MIKKAGILAAVIFILASCAVITVNVYFPEKDVKQAYADLEKDLMKPDSNAVQPDQDKKPESQPQEETPQGKPESSIRFDLVGEAYAQDSDLAQKIADTVKKMPDVVAAYREIGAVVPDLDRLRSGGVVGEANNGLLMPREGSLSPADRQLVDMVNKDRKIIINGMAKAIVRINRQPENPDTLKQVTPEATEQFAAHRRDTAKRDGGFRIAMEIGQKNSAERVSRQYLPCSYLHLDEPPDPRGKGSPKNRGASRLPADEGGVP